MSPDDFEANAARIAALGEPVRRALYRFVVGQDDPVSRERAAAGVGVAHHLAKFHLDRLVEEGLLDAEYRRPPGRGGPGAGRPAKVYRRAADEIALSLPTRRYELAGHIMAEAITAARESGTPLDEALSTAARATGRELARSPAHLDVLQALERIGYEPRPGPDGVTLANCPFHNLAGTHTALVCGINLDLVNGLLDALPATGLSARLAPSPGRCCVTIDLPDRPNPASLGAASPRPDFDTGSSGGGP